MMKSKTSMLGPADVSCQYISTPVRGFRQQQNQLGYIGVAMPGRKISVAVHRFVMAVLKKE